MITRNSAEGPMSNGARLLLFTGQPQTREPYEVEQLDLR